jgi:hypothetical protein
LINKYRSVYLKARKNDKPGISRNIVREIRSKGGRFLKKDERSGLFYEIGDAQAREKTSQALRQRAPEMRKLMISIHHHQAGAAGMAAGGAAPVPSGPPPHAMTGMTDEQYRWAMESMNQPTAAHPVHAMGSMHGVGGAFNPLMGPSPGNAGPLVGAAAYNPALFHAMMAGIGSLPRSGGPLVPSYPQNAAPGSGLGEGVVGEGGGGGAPDAAPTVEVESGDQVSATSI